MNKSKSVVFLIIWFMWSAGKDLDNLVRYSISTDYYIFSSNGLVPLFFIFGFSTFILNTSSVYFLCKPLRLGYYYILAALAVSAVQNITALLLAIPNLTGVRESYTIGRELRGLKVREEALDMIFTTEGMCSSLGFALAIYVLVAFFVVRKKAYFQNEVGTET
ncbi:MAG: hypothetical protein GY795_29165 [Desulfobacterales bacterium]|nr:hypothetical protein [Desulfobacterales bacterium]